MHIKIQKILGIGSLEYYKMIKLHPKYEKKKEKHVEHLLAMSLVSFA